MTDGVIKGTGNSRYLKSVPNALTLYPTHEALMEALAAGTLPIDLNGINPSGWETVGMKLDKANLLTDALCTALGLATTATPNQALDKVRQIASTAQTEVNNGVKFAITSYVGTETYGENEPCHIAFPFKVKVAFYLGRYANGIFDPSYPNSEMSIVLPLTTSTQYKRYTGFSGDRNGANVFGKMSEDGKGIYWYNRQSSASQLNTNSCTYYFYAIG